MEGKGGHCDLGGRVHRGTCVRGTVCSRTSQQPSVAGFVEGGNQRSGQKWVEGKLSKASNAMMKDLTSEEEWACFVDI